MKKLVWISFLILFSCETKNAWIDKDRVLNGGEEPQNWLTLGGNYQMQHYSPLDKINKQNVKELGLAWEYDASSRRGRTQRALEASPIVVDGVLYTSGAWGVVYALDAKTGKEIWRYDPEVDGNYARRACCDVVNRGVQVYEGKVYVGVLDGYLVCLDAVTGKVDWRVDTFTDRSRFYTITSPPQVAGNVVVIGNSGGEFGVRGYITAYDLKTGKQAWRFFIVPGDPAKGFEHAELEMAAKTWDPNSNWEAGLGGTVWGEFTYDPVLNLLYVGTGNSSPYPIWFRSPAGGDNLFLSSVLAIHPDSGKLKWHYQTTPGEIWDYTTTSTLTLADLEINGKSRQVLMTAPKNGFFYVLDRATGEFISAKNFVPVNWASEIDAKTGRPVLTGEGWFKDEPKIVYPGAAGGHSWQPMSYSPQTKLVYIPAMHQPFYYESGKIFKYNRDDNTGTILRVQDQPLPGSTKEIPKEEAFLIAWDPVQQKEVWRVRSTVVDFNGGVLSTAGGLVFEGATDGFFYVYDAATGARLKSIEIGTGIMAAPVSYEIDGEQYVAVMAGYGGAVLSFLPKGAAIEKYQNKGRILVFKLGGGETPLSPQQEKIITPAPPEKKLSEEKIAKGKMLYGQYCGICHGGFGKNHHSAYLDLSKIQSNTHEQFDKIVLDGALSAYGMASFSDVLKPEDADAIHEFIISKQVEVYAEENVPSGNN
jgi:quinohemoprotein ethanol dehydrogenase